MLLVVYRRVARWRQSPERSFYTGNRIEMPLSERAFGSVRTVTLNYADWVVGVAFGDTLCQLGGQVTATTPRCQTCKA